MSSPTTPPPQLTLLVVDDQPANVQALYHALKADHHILMATRGAEALQLCHSRRPDLVLLDVVMPGMDGFEVCRQLKADAATRDIPIIFVTAQGEPQQQTLGLELGAVDFIVKPVNAAVVQARVKTHLGFARSSSLLAATLQASADGILVADLAGGISSMNRAFGRLWNLPAELLDGAPRDAVLEFMRSQLLEPGPPGRAWQQRLWRAAPLPGADALELVGQRTLERDVMPLQINGALRGHVLTFRDVTERRRAAEALRLLNESLEARIELRTQELVAARHLAEAASRAKSEFLSNISHEIRTPINAVVGLASVALGDEPDARRRDVLDKILLSGRQLLEMVEHVLDYSSIEACRLELVERDFLLGRVFDELALRTAEAARAKGLQLVFEIDPSLSRPLRGDPRRLGQVLLNYIGNAIKFTAQGEITVRASAVQGLDQTSLIRCEVRDTGVGLSAAQIEQLFQVFQQLDASTTRRFGGAGLGLAVCRQLAGLMGGEVGVDSQAGQGSTFWFTARLRWGAPLPSALPRRPGPPPSADLRQAIRGARILLVDDNTMNQEVAAGMLGHAGATVRIAGDGQQALDRLEAEPFDCVLMDIQMPVMDGLQATRLIRANPRLAGLPVLAMTANASSEDRARCLEAGMDDFLVKPILADRLVAVVAGWLARYAAAIAAAPAAAAPSPAAVKDVAVWPSRDPQIIDLSILSRFVEGDLQRARRYADLFLASMPEMATELETALGLGDLPRLADLGHRMKSSCGVVGAIGLARLCESLEGLRGGGTLEQARTIAQEIPRLLTRMTADIEAALV